MDPRRRIKYKLARISEEEEEEEADEETSLMDIKTFSDEEDQGSNMSDPVTDPIEDGEADGSSDGSSDETPAPPQSNGISESDETPTDEPTPGVTVVHLEVDTRGAGNNDTIADEGLPSSPPPPDYKDPPSYSECVRSSAVGVAKIKGDNKEKGDDLEWDQDQLVFPNIVINPLDNETSRADETIEMDEMTGQSTRTAEIVETSYITPDLGSGKHHWEPSEVESQIDHQSSCWSGFHTRLSEINSRHLIIILFSVLIAVVAVLIVILLPLTFSYVEYYEDFSLASSTDLTSSIFSPTARSQKPEINRKDLFDEEAFEAGRYAIGPDYTFKKYPSWATHVQLDNIAITTTSELEISFSCSFQYFIREGELGLLEQRFDRGYKDVINFVALAALKNTASSISLSMYIESRRQVEIMFHETLRQKLGGNCCPDRERCLLENTCHLCSNSTTDCNQGYHVDVPFYQLLRINIPDIIFNNNLMVQLMNEHAEMETFIQQAILTRKDIEKSTEEILNLATEVITNSTATANLILSLGETDALSTIEAANSQGLALMYDKMGIMTDQHKASLHWLRTLEKQEMLVMGVSFEKYLQLVKDYIAT